MTGLTAHELRVLRLVALGHTHEQIAEQLVMTRKGVTPTVNRVIRKLGARNAPHAVHLAHQAGILRRERHGDHAGYAAHLYRGETPCELCKAGERAYRNSRRNTRKEAA
ncbi:LuxR C-terminal-related transcriptional regulator [Streptomyces sp. NPDC085946]|uniref:LuxR C-terminal-related transcriptional regulator n=1 Tax=Streptomyces sp. NPDC085946 TaxID=3365744 RepID=UPI0037D879C6